LSIVSDSYGQGALRPARALLGWMSVRRGVLALAGQRVDDERAPEYEERALQKRLVASVRRPAFGTRGVTTGLPSSLQDLAERVGESSRGAQLLASGWHPALVDLRLVCSMGRLAYLDVELPDVEADDLQTLAEITLPGRATGFQVDYDPMAEAWRVDEPTDVRVVGRFQTAGDPGVVLGLVLRRTPSFVQVARVDDRFVLVRGYDRAISLLARGIHSVPALVHEDRRPRDLRFGRSSLAHSDVMGRRPPLLPDFLDEDVSAEVLMPRTRRLLLIRATEVTHLRSISALDESA
jgi:hypothetical protein